MSTRSDGSATVAAALALTLAACSSAHGGDAAATDVVGARDAGGTPRDVAAMDTAVGAPDVATPLDVAAGRDAAAMDAVTPTGDVAAHGDARESGATRDATTADAHPDAGTLSSGCGTTGAAVGDLTLTARDGAGRTRTYEVLVPAGYNPAVPLALTFVYHGAGGDEHTAMAFGLQNAPGAAAASVFVFPRGIAFETYGVGWDDTCTGYDMPFFDAMLAALEARYCIDRDRVYVAGFSWGGDQTTALLCCRGDRIRAAAPASCTDEYRTASDYRTYNDSPCPVATRAAVRFTHATDGDGAYPAPLFATTSALYRAFNACGAASSPVSPSPCVAYAACARPTIECAYPGLGHTLPSGWAADTWAFLAGFH